ncbi:MAG TPA: GNAT family N-acetyltransferase, partial [Acetobacteraceae bacterium]|nr:GNAT family N-acetyltransferase [Acetobacteraceae bacterium]
MDEMRHDSSIARWRQMTEADLPAVESVGRSVHASNPEDLGIYAERLRLYPSGCFVLQGGERIIGYILSHPWLSGQPPTLNSFLERLPSAPDTFYIHDVALLPEARGAGAG